MKLALFKADIKANFGLFCIFSFILSLYLCEIIYMFDPNSSQAMAEVMNLLPEAVVSSLGFDTISTELTPWIGNFYYGFLVFAFPMVYCILLANRLVSKPVDNGSFVYFLLSPTSRTRVIVTQGLFMLLSIAALFMVITGIGVFVSQALFGSLLYVGRFVEINVTAALVTMLTAMISFFYACYFNESRLALAFGAGINIGSLLLFMLGGVSKEAEIFKKLSVYSLLDADKIARGSSSLFVNILITVAIALLFLASVAVFRKKNLPL